MNVGEIMDLISESIGNGTLTRESKIEIHAFHFDNEVDVLPLTDANSKGKLVLYGPAPCCHDDNDPILGPRIDPLLN